ncbi:hypothetical protein [Paenibacillus selenitireducens]|uniref:hypothetical protein n=1 Tax=Paenibacillus selenitireducens TaxID=1324314 RepID=UPI0011800B02|nr:hypothetical protein [Paenibacillus selenitireducens]
MIHFPGWEGILLRRGAICLCMTLVALLLVARNHLGHTIGDWLFRSIGLSPWSRGEQGLHYPNIIGIILLIIGITGAVIYIRPYYPKIRSRMILGSIAFLFLAPVASEKVMFLIKHDAANESSFIYQQLEGRDCHIDQNEENVSRAECKFTYYNYGKASEITLKPVFVLNKLGLEFEPTTLHVSPHSKGNASVLFYEPKWTESDLQTYEEMKLEVLKVK